jgi:outer membrane lipase/esterase
MCKSFWISMISACLALGTMDAQAATPTFDAIYVFGDSYCDVGNLFTATGNTYPPSPYYNGRFSNGPLWIEHVAGYLGVPMQASRLGGSDYAFGGAWVTAPQPLGGGAMIPSVPEQVGLYLGQHGGKADPNALYIIEGGGNDIVGTTSGSPDALGYQIAMGIAESELTLRRAGARHFVIPDLFNVGLLPVASANATFAAAASSAANNWLNTLLGFEQLLEGVHIIRLDVFSLMNAVQTDSTHFGFVDVRDPCLSASYSVCADPDHTYFWDSYHPTVFGHSFFAVTMENALANQPQ